jgi:hypothetical protein
VVPTEKIRVQIVEGIQNLKHERDSLDAREKCERQSGESGAAQQGKLLHGDVSVTARTDHRRWPEGPVLTAHTGVVWGWGWGWGGGGG